jgi:sterol desaturase/sphingolipid hydroxylase (fatty acid hydroxylase superfamily)
MAVALAEVGLIVIAVQSGAGVVTGVLSWCSGALGWTLLEYVLHRFLFHLPRAHPVAFLGARVHLAHHEAPDRTPIVKPPASTLAAFSAGFLVTAAALGPAWSAPVWAGLIAGYFAYELSHLATHLLTDAEHPFPSQRRRHLRHHDDPSALFGVSSPFWDWVLGTRKGAGR